MNDLENEFKYLDYTTLLSFNAVDTSDLPIQEKRNLLFSIYSFRCLFDNKFLHETNKVLLKYGCSFLSNTKGEGCVEIKENNQLLYKYDAGSPMWVENVKNKTITGDCAVYPQKLSLYEMVLTIISLSSATDALKAMWFIHFPFIIYLNAPHEPDLYEQIQQILFTPAVYAEVLASHASDNIYITTEEMLGEPSLIANWYTDYIQWKNVKNEKGVSRELAKYQRELALGNSEYAMNGTEQLLNAFPDDEEIALLNIASRCDLSGKVGLEQRVKLLSDNYKLIADYMQGAPKNYIYFLYYRGLTKLGMQDVDNAIFDFNACLKIDPNFNLAKLMLNGMKYTANRDKKND